MLTGSHPSGKGSFERGLSFEKQAFPFFTQCIGIECKYSINYFLSFLHESLRNELFYPGNSPNRRIPGVMFGRGKNNGFVLTAPKFLNRPGHLFFAHSVIKFLFNLPSVALTDFQYDMTVEDEQCIVYPLKHVKDP